MTSSATGLGQSLDRGPWWRRLDEARVDAALPVQGHAHRVMSASTDGPLLVDVAHLDMFSLEDLIDEVLPSPNVAMTALCWGKELSGGLSSCAPDFQPGNNHFKNKFCDACRRDGFIVAADRVRVICSSLHRHFCNMNGPSIWTNEARLVNQTIKCVGPRVVIFKGPSPPAETAPLVSPVPEQWLRHSSSGTLHVHFTVKLGTAVPSAALQPAGAAPAESYVQASVDPTAKRPREEDDDSGSTRALIRGAHALDEAIIIVGAAASASDADVAALSVATSDPHFQQDLKERLGLCAATFGALRPAERGAMHRMFREAMERRLAASVGDVCLGRLLKSVETGVKVPAGMLDGGAYPELMLLCTTLCDERVWAQVVKQLASHLQQEPASLAQTPVHRPPAELASLTESLVLLSVRDSMGIVAAPGADAPPAPAQEGWRTAVQHTARLMHAMLHADDARWEAVDLPQSLHSGAEGKSSVFTCEQDGLLYCLTQIELGGGSDAWEDAKASGGLGEVAMTTITRAFEFIGMECEPRRPTAESRYEIHGERLWRWCSPSVAWGRVGVDGPQHALVCTLCACWGTCLLEMNREVCVCDDGARVVLIDWDRDRDQPLSVDESRQLANVCVVSLQFNTHTRSWHLSCIETYMATMSLSKNLIGSLPLSLGTSSLKFYVQMTSALSTSLFVEFFTRALADAREAVQYVC